MCFLFRYSVYGHFEKHKDTPLTSLTRPNVLIVVIDSLRADRVSCYGYGRDVTPNLDRIAAEGCRFNHAISAAPFSPASYASLISNLYPHQHGVNGDTVRVWPEDMPRLPARMKAFGYQTFALSNNSFLSRETNSHLGFDRFVDRDETWWTQKCNRLYQRVRRRFGDTFAKRLSNRMHCSAKGDSAATVRRAADVIDRIDDPWFGLIVLMDPHTPYNRRRTHYAGRSREVRRFFAENNNRTMWAELMAARGQLSEQDLAVVTDLYDAEVRHADTCVGRLVDWLRETRRLDDTVVAITADHGEAFGEHDVWGHGFCLNDGLTRVPLIFRHPAYWSAGSQFDGIVQLHDLYETALGVAATGEPATDALPHCLTQAGSGDWPGREEAFSQFPRQSKTLEFMRDRNPDFQPGHWDYGMWAVRSTDWRYIEYDNGDSELYDLNADPGETVSVADEHADVCEALRRKLAAHRSDRPGATSADQTSQEMDEAVRERLRALGYID